MNKFLVLCLSLVASVSFADVRLQFVERNSAGLVTFNVHGAPETFQERLSNTELQEEVMLRLQKDARRTFYRQGIQVDHWSSAITNLTAIKDELVQDYTGADGDFPWSEEMVADLESKLSTEENLKLETMDTMVNEMGGTGIYNIHLIYDLESNKAYKIERLNYAE